MGPLFGLTLRQIAGRWRVLLIVLLAVLPVVLSILVRNFAEDHDTSEFAELFFDLMIVAGILPITIMVLATATFGNELEDKTLSFLVSWRIPGF